MKKLYTIAALLLSGLCTAQSPFWTEDFGTGCNRGQVATAFSGSNGSWTVSSTGTNGNVANDWFVSATSSNTGVGNCADNCNMNSVTNATLHVSNITIVIPSFLTVNADTGASYFSGGLSSFGYVATTARRVESPNINCTGQMNITLQFLYLENGDASNDDASLMYSPDGGITWTTLDALAKTTGTCANLGQWTAFTILLPASANNNSMVRIGFNWVNNDDGVGTDPSFSVDDISLTSNLTGIIAVSSTFDLFNSGDGQIKINTNAPYKISGVYDMLGQAVKFTLADNTIQVAETVSGIYIVNAEVNGIRVIKKIYISE
jgi:hypothetical protein